MHSSTQRSRHCNELQCPALERSRCYWTACIALHCTELQCTALHKDVGVAMHCNALHWTRSRCHWRACIALHCNVLQCTALHKDVGMLTLLRYTTPHHQHHYIVLYYTPAMPTLHLDPCHPATCATHWGTVPLKVLLRTVPQKVLTHFTFIQKSYIENRQAYLFAVRGISSFSLCIQR